MSHRPVRRAAAVLVALALTATACSAESSPPTAGDRAGPWPERPVVGLSMDVAADLASVEGRETVLFTPDEQVCELVFLLWPNKPTTAADGTSMELTDVVVDGVPVEPEISAAGAPEGSPGTLAEIPLPGCVEAGTGIRAELGFTVELGEDSVERVGHSPSAELAWFATAFPMLSWVRGEGWTRDDAVDMFGETVTSEDFRLDALEVTAPQQYAVLGSGTPDGTRPGATPGTTTHRYTAEALRDLTVSVGRFTVEERRVQDVTLRVGVPESGSRVDVEGWTDALDESLRGLSELLGPYPYPELWASILPPLSDGVEFPGALQFGDVGQGAVPGLVAHELAHMWFYSLVGNNQARDPWIDESFATYAQAVVADQEDAYRLDDVDERVAGDLGRPMEFWAEAGGFGRYVRGTYDQGAAVLLEARDQVGEERFDAAMRAYVDVYAHRVVGPDDVRSAFADLPELVDLLEEYGAFTGS